MFSIPRDYIWERGVGVYVTQSWGQSVHPLVSEDLQLFNYSTNIHMLWICMGTGICHQTVTLTFVGLLVLGKSATYIRCLQLFLWCGWAHGSIFTLPLSHSLLAQFGKNQLNSWLIAGQKQCCCVAFKAYHQLKLVAASMSDMYKVFTIIHMIWIDIRILS